MPSVGDMAPDFTLTAHDKSSVTLSEMRRGRVILAFYPAAFTGAVSYTHLTLPTNSLV